MGSRRLLASIVVVAVGFDVQLSAQSVEAISADKTRRIDALFAAWDNTASPGCVLGVSQNGDVLYSRGYGMSNLEADVAMTPGSVISIGSISKQFTAFSIALLASRGTLSLDDDVRRYLPRIPDYGPRITIRHLLTHTSGLRDAWDLVFLAGLRPGDRITQEDVLDMVARQLALDSVPGTEYLYNNAGYILLAEIVEVVSGQSQPDFAEKWIFEPLAMRQTSIDDDRTRLVRGRVVGHRPRAGGGWTKWFPVSEVLGADGVLTTVVDLLKWERNFDDARVGGRALLDEMETSGRLSDGASTDYGFGIELGTYRGVRSVGHGGTGGGYVSNVVRFPEQHLAIAALCNLRSISPRVLTRGVADILLGSVAQSVPQSPAMKVPEGQLAALAGTYFNPLVGLRRFVMQDDWLTTDAGARLTPIGGGRFRGAPNELMFPLPQGGAPQELHIQMPVASAEGRKQTKVFSRVTPPSYSVAELNAYAGDYRSGELAATFFIRVGADGHLAALRQNSDPITLEPIKRDTFFANLSDGAGSVTFTWTGSTVTGFVISGRTPRRLAFTRVDPKPLAGK